MIRNNTIMGFFFKERLGQLLKNMEGKSLNDVIEAGTAKLASVGTGGGGGGGGDRSGAAGGDAPKEEAAEEEEEEEVDMGGGMDMFGGGDGDY